MSARLDRRDFLAAALGAAGWLATRPLHAAVNTERPNILFILSDDQGWPESSLQMDPNVADSTCPYFETPNMIRLSREGMRFASGYSPAPICTPTRRSIQCGMTPARERGTEFPSDNFDPAAHLTIPKALKAVDPAYRCAHFGKWGEQMIATPDQVGYDQSDGVTGNETGGGMGGRDNRLPVVATEPKEDPKLIFSLTKRAMDFMERQVREKHPFYLQVSYYAVHHQIQARAQTIDKYKKKGDPQRDAPLQFAAMLDDLDTGIGQVLAKVDELGIAGNTFVFFSADNGGAEHDPQNPLYVKHLGVAAARAKTAGAPDDAKEEGTDDLPPATNASGAPRLPDDHPLRGSKQWLYEGGIRVPFIVRGPGVQAGVVCREPVAQYDLLPTFVDLAGGAKPLPADIDGGSIRPLLENGGAGSVKRALPGLVFHRPARGYSVLRIKNLKLVLNWPTGKKELFDLDKDIGEEHDLSQAMPEKTEEMYKILTDYLKSVNAETYKPPAPGKKKKAPGKKAAPGAAPTSRPQKAGGGKKAATPSAKSD